MTNKYKVGDEVLVRATIQSISKTLGSYRLHVEKHGYWCYVYDPCIYSLATEFNPGEDAEFSDGDGNWAKAEFVAYVPSALFPYVSFNRNYKAISVHKEARKIKPATVAAPEYHIIDGITYKKVE